MGHPIPGVCQSVVALRSAGVRKSRGEPDSFQGQELRFFFFSREETRMHIHASCPDGEAKFWIEPLVALADYKGLSKHELGELEKVVKDHVKEITEAWKKHSRAR